MPPKIKCFTKPRIPVADGGKGGNYTACLPAKELDKPKKKQKLIITKRVKVDTPPVKKIETAKSKPKLIINKRVKPEKMTAVAPKRKLIITKRVNEAPKTESKEKFLDRVREENSPGGLVAKSIYSTSSSTGGYLGDSATKFKEKAKESFKRKLNQLYRKSTGKGMEFKGRSVKSVGVTSLVDIIMTKTDTPLDTMKNIYDDYIYKIEGGDHFD